MKHDLTIYLITRDRPEFIISTIDSILSQTYNLFDLVISDNSTNDETFRIISTTYLVENRCTYIDRKGIYNSGIEHINAIHREVQSKYYIIFHDDDIMYPNMILDLYKVISSANDIVAVAAYAHVLKGGKLYQNIIRHKKNDVICNQMQLIERYVSKQDMPPFASYMYNNNLLNDVYIDARMGGKYSDCSFIVSLPLYGRVIYIPKHVMRVTIHNKQDSQDHQFLQYLSLIKYLKVVVGQKSVYKITRLRIFNIYNGRVKQYKDKEKKLFSPHIFMILFKYSPTEFFLKYILRTIRLYDR